MSIETQLEELNQIKTNIFTSIRNKGIIVPENPGLKDAAGLIDQIEGGGSSGEGVPILRNIMSMNGVKVVDENGYIGGDFLDIYYQNYYNNFAVVIPGADYSNMGLGSVTFVDTATTIGGRVYRTVTIGGITWLAENLDFKFSGCGIGINDYPTTPNAWYYDNDETTYGIDGIRKCGLLYNWFAVKLLNDNKADLIPGWHVPTRDEWTALINAAGGASVAGTKLKAANVNWATSWGGTNDYEFDVLPAGSYSNYSGGFDGVGTYANFWSSTEYAFSYFDAGSSETGTGTGDLSYGYSVRLVKDSM